ITVSWNEKPTRSLPSTMRRLRQVSDFTSRSVSLRSSRLTTYIRGPFVEVQGSSAMQRAGATGAAPARAGSVSGQDGLGCGSELERSGLDDVESGLQIARVDRQRRHDLDDLVVGTGGLEEQAVVERVGRDLLGHLGVLEAETGQQSATADRGTLDLLDDRVEALVQLGDGVGELVLERVIGPEVLDRGGGGHERGVVPAEGAVVLAGLPDVELGTEQGQCHRQTRTGDRLRQAHDVGLDSGLFEAEERTGAAAACLHVVDDEEDVVLLRQLRQRAQPLGTSGPESALALHGLDDD